MAYDGTIYRMSPSIEEARPVIDFEGGLSEIDWARVDEVLHGRRPLSEYVPLHLQTRRLDGRGWGFFSVPGTLGVVSSYASSAITPDALRRYDLLPLTLDEGPFFFLALREPIACLDPEKSTVVRFRSAPDKVKEVTRFAFLRSMLADPLVFSIPEMEGLFATEGVRQSIDRCGEPGFRFRECSSDHTSS